jgi:hypothetical protein
MVSARSVASHYDAIDARAQVLVFPIVGVSTDCHYIDLTNSVILFSGKLCARD